MKKIFLSTLISVFCSCNNDNNIITNNLYDFSTSSCFIVMNVKYVDQYTIVIDNYSLYLLLKDSYNWSELHYSNKLKRIINKDKYLEIDSCLNSYLKINKVDFNLVDRLGGSNDTIVNYGRDLDMLDPDLSYSETKALIYYLLKIKGINCCVDCESGYVRSSS